MTQPTAPSLLEWFRRQPESEFPRHSGIPYSRRFKDVADLMNEQVHPEVEKGAMLHDGGMLTDHGPKHIATVIDRASSLLCHPEEAFPKLTAYEVYILLLAIHFHDVGNIFGRAKHEAKHADVMDKFTAHLGHETVEKRAILKIAGAHGGTIEGNKDTISQLPREEPVLGRKVQYQALAAILRFADELADDSQRASRIGELLDIIPEGSKVYHAYAKSLHSVMVSPSERRVALYFSFLKDEATRTFGKKGPGGRTEQVFLLDEIFERTKKMHFERKYCMKFTHDFVHIDAIDVKVEVYQDQHSVEPCVNPVGYRLEEAGYPDTEGVEFVDLCPKVELTGTKLSDLLCGEP